MNPNHRKPGQRNWHLRDQKRGEQKAAEGASESSKGNEETLEGVLERIVFADQDNAWSVLKLAVAGRRGQVTVVGNVLGVRPGETLRLAGRWVQDKKWGQQFKASSFKAVKPATLEGIERYLGSGLIRGVGKAMAQRLVAQFGAGTLEIIENHPERLRQVEGIGPKRCEQILEAWKEQRHIQRVMVFLQGHGVSTAYAIRIYKTYGPESETLVSENPYRLATDIHGIGFGTADAIAERLGVPRDSPRRAEAGLLHLLQQASDRGHLFLPKSRLLDEGQQLLEIPQSTLDASLKALIRRDQAVSEIVDSRDAFSDTGDREAIFTTLLFRAEVALADSLMDLMKAPVEDPSIDIERALSHFEKREGLTLATQQRTAIEEALRSKVLVITGGPGTGKTTLLRGIVEILGRKGGKILLAAPTGRAARRLAEATGRDARTVHRLLEFDPSKGAFLRCASLHLEADLVIIDEASMLDTALARSLVEAVPPAGKLILVGDVDQLPSVGPGRVLADLINSGALAVVRLTEIFRQAESSRIVVNAHRVNRGEIPLFERGERASQKGPLSDFFFIPRQEPEELLETLIHLVTERIPRSFGFHPVEEIQVLAPMNRGLLGVHNLNAALQERLNPTGSPIPRSGGRLKVADKVMQLRNNYELEVFNGDLGRILSLDEEEEEISVDFEGRRVLYPLSDLDELAPAYACSIHKSQGSEYPCVVVPLHSQHFLLLQRNLLYTALTRAKKLAVLLGQPRALTTAVRNQDTRSRFTRLAQRLRAGKKEGLGLPPTA